MTISRWTQILLIASLVHSSDCFVPTFSNKDSAAPSCLFMTGGSQRAFFEKNLEDAMGNDWREFRARLVAQEAVNTRSRESSNKKESSSRKIKKEKQRQGDLGDMFAEAISSIFHPKEKERSSKRHHNILDGDNIGNAILPEQMDCEDPFVSHEELPILLENKVSIDKQRWAHPIPHVEPGCVLLSNELLGGVFRQTVVLIIDHSETQGTTGIIINRPLKSDLQTVATMRNTTLDLSLKLAFSEAPVTYGGPVNSDQFSILHGFGEVEGSRKVAPGIFVGGSEELMDEVRMTHLDPKEALFVKGHAAWVAGQLKKEICKDVWYSAAVSSDFILRYASTATKESDTPSDLWSEIMQCMGDEFATLALAADGRGDYRMAP